MIMKKRVKTNLIKNSLKYETVLFKLYIELFFEL